jgi:hypothetical protein
MAAPKTKLVLLGRFGDASRSQTVKRDSFQQSVFMTPNQFFELPQTVQLPKMLAQ